MLLNLKTQQTYPEMSVLFCFEILKCYFKEQSTKLQNKSSQIWKKKLLRFTSNIVFSLQILMFKLMVTWAAITLCLSVISLHLRHWHSLQLQKRLCPFRGETQPWFLQREHLGILGGFWPLDRDRGLVGSSICLFGLSLLMATGNKKSGPHWSMTTVRISLLC